jgi:hypothetical protein
MSSNYETLYGVGFLDDLHNYFPALLYDSSSFENVQSVLAYMQRQTRNRFDLFSYGQREYQNIQPPVSVSQNSYHRVVRTSFAAVPTPGHPTVSTLRSVPLNPNATEYSFLPTMANIQVELNQIDQGEEEEEEVTAVQTNLANALLNLLNLPVTRNYMMPNGRARMDQFLQPVVIHPTSEQIASNTTVGNLVSDTDNTCAICQDTLTCEQEARKLNACGHWFHRPCIDTWLQGNVHCPVCRHDIREPIRQEPPS